MITFAVKIGHIMLQEEITFQALTNNEDIHVGYSDSDIVIVDSIQKFAEISAAHITMSAIAICLSGKVQGLMNGQPITLRKNQVAVIPPNVNITELMISPDFDIKAMFFTNGILQSFLREKMNVWNDMMYIHRLHVITLEEDENLLFFKQFYDMLSFCMDRQDENPFSTDIIQSLLRAVVLGLCGNMKLLLPDRGTVLSSQRKNRPSSSANTHFQRFLDLLHTEHSKHRTVESYANELCISPKYLSAICKRNSGKTANEWITEHVMEDIRYYLKQTDYSIKQICNLLGFPNPSFFGKYVKEHFGITPTQLRNNSQ